MYINSVLNVQEVVVDFSSIHIPFHFLLKWKTDRHDKWMHVYDINFIEHIISSQKGGATYRICANSTTNREIRTAVTAKFEEPVENHREVHLNTWTQHFD